VQEQRAVFCERAQAIRDERLRILQASRVKEREREVRDVATKQKLTLEIDKYGGLWTTLDEIDEQLESLGERSKLLAVSAQLRFRRVVLGMKNENGVFNLSKDRRRLPLETLTRNLRSVVQAPLELEDTEDRQYGCASAHVFAEAKAEFIRLAEKQQALVRDLGRKRGGLSKVIVPDVQSADQLLGKIIRHGFDEDGTKVWYRATVIGEKEVNGKTISHVRYDGEKRLWWFDLWSDFQEGYVELLSVSAADMIGRKIKHMYIDSDDGLECWYPGRVVGCSTGSLLVEYEGEDEEEGVYECPLLDDYLNHEVRFT